MSLCLANVDDSQIRTIVNEQWGLSAKEINELFRDKSICSKIKQNKTLWKYKNNPDKQEDYH